jgi:hypothetical protein
MRFDPDSSCWPLGRPLLKISTASVAILSSMEKEKENNSVFRSNVMHVGLVHGDARSWRSHSPLGKYNPCSPDLRIQSPLGICSALSLNSKYAFCSEAHQNLEVKGLC